jgi:hypothetical protein
MAATKCGEAKPTRARPGRGTPLGVIDLFDDLGYALQSPGVGGRKFERACVYEMTVQFFKVFQNNPDRGDLLGLSHAGIIDPARLNVA